MTNDVAGGDQTPAWADSDYIAQAMGDRPVYYSLSGEFLQEDSVEKTGKLKKVYRKRLVFQLQKSPAAKNRSGATHFGRVYPFMTCTKWQVGCRSRL